MLCKVINKKKYWAVLILIGLVSLVFGIVSNMGLPEGEHDMSMLMGMFTGIGAAFAAVGTIKVLHLTFASPQKLKQEQIDQQDERNLQIMRLSYTAAAVASLILFAVMAFLFVYLGYRTAAFISIGALYIQLLVFLIANRYYNSKM